MKRKPLDIRDYTDWTKADFAEDLRTHPRYQAFFEQYDENSVVEFIKNYAEDKHEWHTDKNNIYGSADCRRTQFLSSAERFLEFILQKKMFNLQCLWRAELIDLPFIENTYDFKYFSNDILNCPFIEPITEEEIEVGIRFLMESEAEIDPDYPDWQNYGNFKIWEIELEMGEEIDKSDGKAPYYGIAEEMPPFYTFYDTYMKTGHLFNLPDIRWIKEKYYLDAVRAENQRKHEKEKVTQDPKPPYKPSLYHFYKDEFMAACEDPVTQELYGFVQEAARLYRYDEFSNDLEFLMELRNMGEEIALVPHTDWYQGVADTVRHVRNKKTADMLPYAHQTYLLEFEDCDWETLQAQRVARFQFDEESYNYYHLKDWRETLARGKALREEE
jgi:hypothetical protein